jgi:hypothetical protein
VPDKTGARGAPVVCPAYGANICETVQPDVLVMLSLPPADYACDLVEDETSTPVGYVAINLPGRPRINGFLFSKKLSSDALDKALADILGAPGQAARQAACQAATRRQQYDAEMQATLLAIQAGTADPGTQASADQLRHLAASIHFD